MYVKLIHYYFNTVYVRETKKVRFLYINWPSGSGEEDFLNLSKYFRIISPWKICGPSFEKILESLWPKDDLCQEGRGPSFEQNWIPFTQECILQSLVEIGPVILEKKMEMWKVYDNDNNEDE